MMSRGECPTCGSNAWLEGATGFVCGGCLKEEGPLPPPQELEEEKEDPNLPLRNVTVASTVALRFVEATADVFMEHVMQMTDYLITDESMIHDFSPTWEDHDKIEVFENEVVKRTKDIFGVDISAITDKKLPEIFVYIAKQRREPGFPETLEP